jgi:hypothetical protein
MRPQPKSELFDKAFYKGSFPLTNAAGQAKNKFLPEGGTLALEEFKYALESWRLTQAIAH